MSTSICTRWWKPLSNVNLHLYKATEATNVNLHLYKVMKAMINVNLHLYKVMEATD